LRLGQLAAGEHAQRGQVRIGRHLLSLRCPILRTS
jgi:hypothetical protein